ncbi:hypothetical protein IV454_27830 [Massilia antarctica]|uniref:Uncharacterized protein n=1 Tax=Massilia antarctica TaxID=2765360 RepID=A0AA48WB57_9BURK|nr:hypothetical protein [Massilia antarctica]QPI49223.1 hypothetical protein IV454_27830 [Massilia antarctica]
MRDWTIVAFLLCYFFCVDLHAENSDVTWKYERAVDYDYPENKVSAPQGISFIFKDDELKISSACTGRVTQKDYAFSDVFQPLSKEGVTGKQLDVFLMKNFKLGLSKVKRVYKVTSPGRCSKPLTEFFVFDDKILAVDAMVFYVYGKANADARAEAESYAGYKLSQLPMNFDHYYAVCEKKILDAHQRPRTTDKCGPKYYPYVADPKKNDPIMSLVGNHDFAKFGAEYANGFSPAFAQKTRATFMLFPPMSNVLLIRVDDFDLVRSEERDVMSGAYITVVNGKVIGQIQGCNMNERYECILDQKVVAKVLPSGKIQSIIPF